MQGFDATRYFEAPTVVIINILWDCFSGLRIENILNPTFADRWRLSGDTGCFSRRSVGVQVVSEIIHRTLLSNI